MTKNTVKAYALVGSLVVVLYAVSYAGSYIALRGTVAGIDRVTKKYFASKK